MNWNKGDADRIREHVTPIGAGYRYLVSPARWRAAGFKSLRDLGVLIRTLGSNGSWFRPRGRGISGWYSRRPRTGR